jgi:hypothetical protein
MSQVIISAQPSPVSVQNTIEANFSELYGPNSAIIVTSAPITTVDTYVTMPYPLPVPPGLVVGQSFGIKIFGMANSASSGTVFPVIHVGPSGSTADTALLITPGLSAASPGATAFVFDNVVTVLALGVTGRFKSEGSLLSPSTTQGIASNQVQAFGGVGAGTTVNTTVPLFLGFSISSATCSIQITGAVVFALR